MKILRKVFNKSKKLWLRFISDKINIIRMKNLNVALLNFIIKAYYEIKNQNFSENEKEYIKKIEIIRYKYLNSKKSIDYKDFGAGSPNSDASENILVKNKLIHNICKASIPFKKAILLFKVVRNLKPNNCLELGTCLGISSSYISSALQLNQKGFLFTIEGDPQLAALSEKNFQELNLKNIKVFAGRFQDILDEVLKKHNPIDFVFIDGHHTEKATLKYFNIIFPYLSDRSILIFDDIKWSNGMNRAWKRIKTNQKVNFSIDLGEMGIIFILKEKIKKKHFKMLLLSDFKNFKF